MIESTRAGLGQGIERSEWGRTEDGDVCLYRLQNRNGLSMNVTNYGAIVQSLLVPDRDGSFANVVLGYDRLEKYLQDPFYIGALVGRYAGRIAGGAFELDGTKLQLSTTPGGFHHHGGRRGLSRKTWFSRPFAEPGGSGIILHCASVDGEEGFPGNLEVELVYTLTDNDEWIVDIKASSDKPTVLNLTQHAYFNLSGQQGSTVDEHLLRLPVAGFLPVSSSITPLGHVQHVSGTPFDFQQLRRIGDGIGAEDPQINLGDGYDHTWVIKESNDHSLQPAATLHDPPSGRVMDVLTTEPGVHFYSGNFLSEYNDESGERRGFRRRAALCLETQHFGDSPNHPNFPSTVLRAGEFFESRTVFKFSTL